MVFSPEMKRNEICARISSFCIELTRDDGNSLKGSQHSESSEGSQVAQIDAHGEVSEGDDDEVEPVPGVPQVGELGQGETPTHHLRC